MVTWENVTRVVTPTPEALQWYTGNKNGDIHIFEDIHLPEHINYNGKIKIALLEEVPTIYDFAHKCNSQTFHPYNWIKENHHHFDYVFSPYTFLKNIVGEHKYQWICSQNCYIPKEQFGLYEKERLLSIIASFKTWTVGHRMRHEIIKQFPGKMDIYGGGYNTILDDYASMGKIIALAPYYFSIVVPNTNIDDWFSEQLTDAMVVGTIPIFCGTKSIHKYFSTDGIIQFDTVNDLEKIIPTLSKELYQSKMSAVLDNLERAKTYTSSVDWLYKNKRDFLENLKKV